jgi:hypothetical protein
LTFEWRRLYVLEPGAELPRREMPEDFGPVPSRGRRRVFEGGRLCDLAHLFARFWRYPAWQMYAKPGILRAYADIKGAFMLYSASKAFTQPVVRPEIVRIEDLREVAP